MKNNSYYNESNLKLTEAIGMGLIIQQSIATLSQKIEDMVNNPPISHDSFECDIHTAEQCVREMEEVAVNMMYHLKIQVRT